MGEQLLKPILQQILPRKQEKLSHGQGNSYISHACEVDYLLPLIENFKNSKSSLKRGAESNNQRQNLNW